MNWICCQLGAREHYAVARAFRMHGALKLLITDAWLPPSNPLKMATPRLRERFHQDLAGAHILAANFQSISFELRARMAGLVGWSRTIARNEWFQKMAVAKLSRMVSHERRCTLFAYSYAARSILEFARAQGWQTVLGQIDAGAPDERITARLYAKDPTQRGQWERAPSRYWMDWKQECELADRIVVNSAWSQAALEEEGVPASKICVVPLAYEGPSDAKRFQRAYPQKFTPSRPLRVLFLGNIELRKGVGALFDAMRLLRGQAIEFWFVGAIKVSIPADLRDDPRVHWIERVPRCATAKFYRDADVFLFPTFSDGFGLTQLEAQAWKLPIITTKFCGAVVENERNGWVLSEPTATALVAALRSCFANPDRLREFAANSVELERFGLTQIGKQWLHIFE